MLWIDCPWCGPRPETEFRYGGETYIARPEPAATGAYSRSPEEER